MQTTLLLTIAASIALVSVTSPSIASQRKAPQEQSAQQAPEMTLDEQDRAAIDNMLLKNGHKLILKRTLDPKFLKTLVQGIAPTANRLRIQTISSPATYVELYEQGLSCRQIQTARSGSFNTTEIVYPFFKCDITKMEYGENFILTKRSGSQQFQGKLVPLVTPNRFAFVGAYGFDFDKGNYADYDDGSNRDHVGIVHVLSDGKMVLIIPDVVRGFVEMIELVP